MLQIKQQKGIAHRVESMAGKRSHLRIHCTPRDTIIEQCGVKWNEEILASLPFMVNEEITAFQIEREDGMSNSFI
jgi:hypothetical protein